MAHEYDTAERDLRADMTLSRQSAGKRLVPDPPPRELPSEEYGRFEELTRRLVSSRRPAGSGAA